MTPEERSATIEAYLDGTITAEEAGRLAAALRAGGPESESVLQELEFTGLLSQSLENADADAFVRSFFERLEAEGSKTDFVRALEERARHPHAPDAGGRGSTRRAALRRPRRAGGSPWILALAAAGLFAAVILAAFLSGGSTEPRPGIPERVARAEQRRRAVEELRQAEAERARVEERVRRIERDRERATPAPAPGVDPEKRRQELEAERRQLEAEVRAAVDRERGARERVARAERDNPRPEPLDIPPAKTEKPAPSTPAPTVARVIAARIERVEGEVLLLPGRAPAQAGGEIAPGQGLETRGDKSLAVAGCEDGTRIELRGNAVLREFSLEGGKRAVLDQGALAADVSRQPAGRPMVVATPHAEARVVGTRFTLAVAAQATRLEVREGRVRLTRRSDGASVEVAADRYAVAARGAPLAAKPIPIDEILLLGRDAKITGKDWQVVADEKASTGSVLEAPRLQGGPFPSKGSRNFLRNFASYATFAFTAEADKEYRLWIRGACTAAENRENHDAVAIEPAEGRFARPCSYFYVSGDNAFMFDYFSRNDGYGWVGGNEYDDKTECVLRFARAGPQALRLYAIETPMRIDALWLSATQKTRPAADQFGPRPGK